MSELKNELLLLKITGEDKPGLTSALTGILARYDCNILDIGQADIHNTLSLGILFEVPSNNESAPVLKDLLFKAYELGLNASFTPVSNEEYSHWVGMQGKNRYIVTLLGRKLSAKQISSVTGLIASQGLNIDNITRLTGRIPLDAANNQSRSCVQLSVRGFLSDKALMQKSFMDLSKEQGIDVAFQEDNIYRRNRRLVCFDMDSTLIQTEVIDEMAERHGVGEEVRAITESAMRGEIDFSESFKKRLSLLRGLEVSVLNEIAENLPVTEGAARLISTLKKFGFKIAILSGGFTFFGESLKRKLDIDYVYANEFEIENDKLTGGYVGEIVDGKRKAELLKLLAQVEKLNLEQVIAVGDGANDLPMLNLAGLGIAYHAKPKVKENAQHAISSVGLDGILYLLGFNDLMIDHGNK
ncbi:phosphoserine phosphatase SerB [Saccharicrinis sp. FJH62]|uniref:phosphoserine phosphatase SerB n=1 Tax=Saccharicrinis sp. FJH62 TaxID=3344657 RepID=UPI0035D4AE99